jgi:flagellar biosynthetic protein FlhB
MMLVMMAADNRTEKPTPKKRRETREKGEVRKSTELNAAITLLALFASLNALKSYIGNKTVSVFTELYQSVNPKEGSLDLGYIRQYFLKVIVSIFLIVGPVLAVSFVLALCVNYLQFGFLFSTKALKPQFSRLNPIKGLKRMISSKSLVELLKSVIKFVIIAGIVIDIVKDNAAKIPYYMTVDIPVSFLFMTELTMDLALKTGLYLMIYAVGDFLYTWWEYEKNLRMTKQEVKEEYKMLEGNPEIKGQIKRKQREISMGRMMQAVPEADVVVTNPTTYAVALKYDDKKHAAPVVTAKGKGYVAKRIKEKAKEHGVEIVENKPLAQALYKSVDVGRQIPEEFYKAVAEILAWVYGIKGKYREV